MSSYRSKHPEDKCKPHQSVDQSPGSDGQRKLKVLLAETDLAIRASMTSTLLEDCQVLSAENAPQVLAALRGSQFDLLLCDVALPPGGGLALLRDVHSQAPKLAVVMMLSQIDTVSANLALKGGALDCVVKPITREVVLRLISRLGQHQDATSGKASS